ncbi:cation:proton antiporter [Streptomyces gamaensis]|uniref:Cation:proton antiporter n=1 Tax=Streptomyces gamaensis TaxID=1763542 RepID=A0ABW0Z6N0_9ACTN
MATTPTGSAPPERHSRSHGRTRRPYWVAVSATALLPLAAVGYVIAATPRSRTTAQHIKPTPLLDTTAHFLLAACLVLAVAHLAGRLAERLGQPKVIGEICAGISLGPSLLGRFAPGAVGWLFPQQTTAMLNGLAQLGLVVFMFGVGQELGGMRLRGAARQALLVSQASLLLPFAAGALLAVPLSERYLGTGGSPLAFVLFLGCALSITAFPVLARILEDLGLTRTRPGRLSLFAAAVGDGGSWLLLAVVLAVTQQAGPARLLIGLGGALALAVVCVGPVRAYLARRPDRDGTAAASPALSLLLVAGIAGTSVLSASVGIHQLIGALLAGLAWPAHRRWAAGAAAPLTATARTVLLPFFFLGFGLSVDIGSPSTDGTTALVLAGLLAAAVLTKIVGPGLCARLTGLPWRESLTLGVLLNARGLTELVVLQIGHEARLIDDRMLSLLTIVALVTTVLTAPLLRLTGAHRLPVTGGEPVPPKEPAASFSARTP